MSENINLLLNCDNEELIKAIIKLLPTNEIRRLLKELEEEKI